MHSRAAQLVFSKCIPRIGLASQTVHFNYISKKALDEIGKGHGQGVWSRTKMYTMQAKHIMTEGMLSFKRDMSQYVEMRKRLGRQNSQPTEQDRMLMKRMQGQIRRMKTMVIIQILPFSGPILLYYLYTYPNQIPSWFCIDQIFEKYQRQCIAKQLQRVEDFKENPLNVQNFSSEGLSIEQLKRISQLLYGHYDDGVAGINKMFKDKQRDYIIHPHFSKYLVRRNLKKQFKIQTKDDPTLATKTFDELILWKYDRIITHGDRLSFMPVLEPEQIKEIPEEQDKGEQTKQQSSTVHPSKQAFQTTQHPQTSKQKHNQFEDKEDSKPNK